MVIDLRGNGGGNNTINRPLIEALTKRPNLREPGRLLVLIDRGTFSAAVMCALELKRLGHVVFAGEPTRGKPNSYSESGSFELPSSRLTIGFSEKFWELDRSLGDAPWIAPDVAVAPSIADYRAGRDPVLERALAVPVTD